MSEITKEHALASIFSLVETEHLQYFRHENGIRINADTDVARIATDLIAEDDQLVIGLRSSGRVPNGARSTVDEFLGTIAPFGSLSDARRDCRVLWRQHSRSAIYQVATAAERR